MPIKVARSQQDTAIIRRLVSGHVGRSSSTSAFLTNFLDDKIQSPHMKLTAIDKTFGVGKSTGQGKSMLIRKMFKIGTFDPDWILPSRLDVGWQR